MAHAGHAHPDVGQHVDDGAAIGCHRLVVDLAAHQEAAGQVVAHHRVPALGRNVLERRGELPAGVVDQAVDAAMRGQHVGDGLLDGFFLANVAYMAGGAPADFGDFTRHGFELFDLAADQRDAGAQRHEFMGGAAADAGAAAGDKHGLAGKKARTEDGLVGHC